MSAPKVTRRNVSAQDGPYYVPRYEIRRGGVLIGMVIKTGTHLDNYPWDWQVADGIEARPGYSKRYGHAGLLSEAIDELADCADTVQAAQR